MNMNPLMMRTLKSAALMLALLVSASAAHAQARLVVKNQSQREMTIKVMRADADGGSRLHATTDVAPYGTQTIFFSDTGTYFLKTMATLSGREPIYQKGAPFAVYSGRDGYSIRTVTFTIVESAEPHVLGGQEISKQEFDRDGSGR